MKQALFWLAIIPIIGGAIFFWFNSSDPTESAIDFAPEGTWIVFQAKDIADFHSDIADSNSFYRSIPIFTGMTDDVMSFLSPFSDAHLNGSLFISGIPGSMNYVLVLNTDEGNLGIDAIQPIKTTNQYQIFAHDSAYSGMNESQRMQLTQALTSNADLSVSIASTALNQVLSGSFSTDMFNQISNEYDDATWLQFDLKSAENMYASGVTKTIEDESTRLDATPLLSYLPTETESALLYGTIDYSIGIASCPYVAIEGEPDQNTFILYQDSGIQARISNPGFIDQGVLPDFEGVYFRPKWSAECVRLELGDVDVYCKNDQQAKRFYNDYLAYNRFTDANAYTSLSETISNASFTLLLRTPNRHTTEAFLKDIDSKNQLNAIVFQTNTEIPKRKHFSFAALHHREIKEGLKSIWTCELEKPISNGPWPFVNHYTQNPEIVVQDKLNQLYLINSDGKILWKRLLDSDINGSIQQLDAFESGKNQMLFCTNKRLYLVDRNGNDVDGFPVKFDTKINSAPSAIRYESGADLRILVSSGNVVKNIDQNGEMVDGWNAVEIGPTSTPIEWHNISGKDYLIAIVNNQTIEVLDRAGKRRQDPKVIAGVSSHLFMEPSSTLENFTFIYSDSVGNLTQENLKGSKSEEALIPLDSNVNLLYNSTSTTPFGFTTKNRIVFFDRDLNVVMDYLFPFEIDSRSGWANRKLNWMSVFDRSKSEYYLFDTETGALAKMPISGGQGAIVIDLDKNGEFEVVVGNKIGEFTAYRLSY
jgi:hypothetical protein